MSDAPGFRIDVYHHSDPTSGVNVASQLDALQSLASTILKELRTMSAAFDRIQADVAKISADIAAISDRLNAAAGGLTAEEASAIADSLDTAVTALDVLAAPSAAPAEPPAP